MKGLQNGKNPIGRAFGKKMKIKAKKNLEKHMKELIKTGDGCFLSKSVTHLKIIDLEVASWIPSISYYSPW